MPPSSVGSEEPLETSRLLLEPLRKHHARLLFPVLLYYRIYRFIPDDPPASVDELENHYERLESRASPAGHEVWLNWALLLKSEDKHIGIVQATIEENGCSEIAYQLAFDYWRRGYAFEACSRMLDFIC
ncbi:MAG: hypothetical protein DMF61_26550 [Blastocatellia bacterium AA13]|nr:MAG: hypothetical protein DMF61_26550 [Blastocatellia bacterium AA13]